MMHADIFCGELPHLLGIQLLLHMHNTGLGKTLQRSSKQEESALDVACICCLAAALNAVGSPRSIATAQQLSSCISPFVVIIVRLQA